MRATLGCGHARAYALLVCFGLAGATGAAAQADASDRYRIEATLDPARREVLGEEHIAWTNRSRVPVSALFFHLYANAFANGKTVFMREQGERIRGSALREPGGIDVLSLRASDGSDLLARAHTDLAAGDATQKRVDSGDATQMRVDLAQPLAPGARIELALRFRVRLPSIVARMGAAHDFFMVAQWFPKLCVLEPDGRWASFPYHGLGEFYAGFADYDLSVRVPKGFVVAAPGELQSSALEGDGSRVERYVLRRAIDIAWAASPRFERERVRTAGDARGDQGIDIEVFAPRGHALLARAQAELLRAGLAYFERAYGPYPHRRLVLVLPPRTAHGAAGMEYPGLIVGWSVATWTELNPAAWAMHDLVSAHELAHQWFALLLASNEVETPMLDEGLAEWAGLDFLRPRYGRAFWQRWFGLPIDTFEIERAALVRMAAPPSSLAPAYRYRASTLSGAVYLRPALALESIRRTWGAARFSATLGAYAREQRFRHPTLNDLWAAFDRGYYAGFAQQVLRPALEGTSADTHIAITAETARLHAERDGAVALPAQIEVARGPGAERHPWPANVQASSPQDTTALAGMSIDPDRHNLLDRARADDQMRIASLALTPPLLARLLLWAQALLAGLGP